MIDYPVPFSSPGIRSIVNYNYSNDLKVRSLILIAFTVSSKTWIATLTATEEIV